MLSREGRQNNKFHSAWVVGPVTNLRHREWDNERMEVRNIESFLSYLESIRARTMRVVQAIPPDKLEWRHTESVFSPGDLARHIATTERYTFAENILGRSSHYQGCGPKLADGHTNVIAFMNTMHAEAVGILQDLKSEQLEEQGTSPEGVPVTRWKLLRAMVEHEVHHRGELYVYLALLGVARPPLYGLTEPELRQRSVS